MDEWNYLEIWHDVIIGIGQTLLTKMKNEKKFRVLFVPDYWTRIIVPGTETIHTTIPASAVSRTLCSTRSGLSFASPFVHHASFGEWYRYPLYPVVIGAFKYQNHPNIYSGSYTSFAAYTKSIVIRTIERWVVE